MIRIILLLILCLIGMQYYLQTEQFYAEMQNNEQIAMHASVKFGVYFPENKTLLSREDIHWIERAKSGVQNYLVNKTTLSRKFRL